MIRKQGSNVPMQRVHKPKFRLRHTIDELSFWADAFKALYEAMPTTDDFEIHRLTDAIRKKTKEGYVITLKSRMK